MPLWGQATPSLKFVGHAVRNFRSEYSWELAATVVPKRNFLFFMETSSRAQQAFCLTAWDPPRLSEIISLI